MLGYHICTLANMDPDLVAPALSAGDLLQKRLIELELRYMALERVVDELSGVVAAQQKVIDALQADVTQLNAKSHGFSVSERTPEDDRPPHY